MDEALARKGVLGGDAAFHQKPFAAARLSEKVREVLAPRAPQGAAGADPKKPGSRKLNVRKVQPAN
jgi:hypothetical protein